MKALAYNLYCVVSGRGGGFLVHKKTYHEMRAAEEQAVLAEAAAGADLFEANVCPACGGEAAARRFRNPVGFSFAVCSVDGTVYMDPIPTDSTLTRLNNGAAETYNFLGERASEQRVRADGGEDFAALVRWLGDGEAGEPQRTLLDVGCSTGGFLLTARAEFAVEGLELNGETAEVARQQGLAVTTGRLEELPGRERYDVVTLRQVIEHLPRPAETLLEIHRLLSAGGHLFLATPNVDSASFAYLGEHHIHVASFGHVSLFRRAGLQRLAERCGFELVAHEHCSGRDLQLHDAVAWKLARRRFRHRMALYSPRLYHASQLVDRLTFGRLAAWLFPPGNDSYQRALLRKRD